MEKPPYSKKQLLLMAQSHVDGLREAWAEHEECDQPIHSEDRRQMLKMEIHTRLQAVSFLLQAAERPEKMSDLDWDELASDHVKAAFFDRWHEEVK